MQGRLKREEKERRERMEEKDRQERMEDKDRQERMEEKDRLERWSLISSVSCTLRKQLANLSDPRITG